MQQQRVTTIVLLIGLALAVATLGSAMTSWRMPGNEQGYAPKQPLAFSHRLHAGELGMDCKFCHFTAEKGKYAGIPSSDTCMKCHQVVSCSFDVLQQELTKADKEKRKPKRIISDELRKLYDSLALDENLKPKAPASPRSIAWVRVHNLPAHVRFDHRAHVIAGVTCQRCHGPVESMQRLKQHSTLSMGWCVNCHRQTTKDGVNGKPVRASTSCAVCHY